MSPLRWPTLLLISTLLLGLAAPALVGQDDESGETAIERALRDQTRVGLRLKSLREKMERLAQRYDDEGRTRNATLLREALKALDDQKLLELADQVERSLEQSNLSTVEQQDALSTGLESVYALLRDRKDADELAHQADLARQGLAELGVLAENERRLLAATRATTDREGELTQQALDQASQLDRALAAAQSATRSLQAADKALGEAALAEQLAAQQRALAAEPQPAAAIQKLLEEALLMLREKLDQPIEAAGLGDELLAAAEQGRAQAKQSAAQAAERMAAAREQLARAEAQAGAKSQPGADAESKPGDKSGGESGEQGSEKGGEQTGEQTGEKGGEQGGEKGGEQGGQKPGEQSGGPESPKSAGDPKLEAAKSEMEQAAQALDAVSEALDRSERSLTAARNRAQASALASSKQAETAGKTMEELAERLEAVAPEDGPELLDRTRKLLEQLTQAAQAQQGEQPDDAAAAQSAAQLSLAELLAMLQQRSQTADDSQRQPPTAPELADLAQRQDELQRRARELMQRLKELPDQGFQEPGAKADQSMSGASAGLRSGDSQEAGRKEQDAAEQLDQAAKKLSGAADQYEQLRQDELLFRVGEELKGLLERQDKVSEETRELDAAAAGAERLSRSQRRTVVRLSDEEKDLATHSESVRGTLEQDGALAFAFALQRCHDDLSSAAELLSEEQTGEFVQTVQDDVSRQLRDLLAVLDDEIERRHNAETSPPEEGQPAHEAPPPLVPKVAELLLIQRMEQSALARLDNFIRLNPVDQEDGLGPVERRLLERWSLEHLKVTELFESMVPKAPQLEPSDGGGSGPGKGPQPAPKKEGDQ